MSSHQRQRSHTTSENAHGLNAELNKSPDSVSKGINTNNRTSLPPSTNKFFFIINLFS